MWIQRVIKQSENPSVSAPFPADADQAAGEASPPESEFGGQQGDEAEQYGSCGQFDFSCALVEAPAALRCHHFHAGLGCTKR